MKKWEAKEILLFVTSEALLVILMMQSKWRTALLMRKKKFSIWATSNFFFGLVQTKLKFLKEIQILTNFRVAINDKTYSSIWINFHNFQYVSTCNTIKCYIEKGVVWRLSEFFFMLSAAWMNKPSSYWFMWWNGKYIPKSHKIIILIP